MSIDGRTLRRAELRFDEDRRQRAENFQRRREAVFTREPRLREIDQTLKSTTSRIVASAFRRGTDPQPALAALREENLRLQAERGALLRGLGLAESALDEVPNCPLCGDTGYRGGVLCRCLREYCAAEQQKELSRLLDLTGQSFDTFSLEWYSDRISPEVGLSPRENMERIYEICANFAHTFGPRSGNLMLTGPTGLGKTFLSACIAREVSGGGASVVYDTAARVFDRFEAVKFGREESGAEVERVLRCDLLILDDLGTEMTTAFVQSALYQIVNERLTARRSTILSTNLTPEALVRRYSPQIASRVEGEYLVLPFFGEDIRQLKRARRD